MKYAALTVASLVARATAHYTFGVFTVGGTAQTEWEYVRETDNYSDLGPLTDVTSSDMTCYDASMPGTASTITLGAGSTVGFNAYGNPSTLYHPGVVNVYMAAAPSGTSAADFDGSGNVWFKVYEITAVTDGGSTITFPAENLPGVSFTIPSEVPSGQYLIRMEAIALHSASYYGGAQFYIGCANVEITGGGNGTPGPLVAFPGEYTGYEPGILIDIYYPIPANYTQPGPPVWPSSGSSSTISSSSHTISSASSISSQSGSSTATSTSAGATQTVYGQCGGTGYTGATTCAAGSTCSDLNAYYSQCLP